MAETAIALPPPLVPLPLIEGSQDDGTLNKTLNAYVWQPPQRGWIALFLIGLAGTGVLFSAIAKPHATGMAMPQRPTPWVNSHTIAPMKPSVPTPLSTKPHHHKRPAGRDSTRSAILSVMLA